MTVFTKTHTLQIDGMSGDTCVQKVTAALKGVQGVTDVTGNVGSATFSTETQAKTQEARAAIATAGYKVADRPVSVEKPAAEAPKPVVAAATATDASKVIPKSPVVEGGAQPALASNR